MHVRKNDRVIVIAGKEKGKVGRVLRVLLDSNRVLIEGLNKINKAGSSRKRPPSTHRMWPSSKKTENPLVLDPKP
jgi:large subunit ribosomal protein L24